MMWLISHLSSFCCWSSCAFAYQSRGYTLFLFPVLVEVGALIWESVSFEGICAESINALRQSLIALLSLWTEGTFCWELFLMLSAGLTRPFAVFQFRIPARWGVDLVPHWLLFIAQTCSFQTLRSAKHLVHLTHGVSDTWIRMRYWMLDGLRM